MDNSINDSMDQTSASGQESDSDHIFDDMNTFMAAEDSMPVLHEGQIIKGTVLRVDSTGVIVDIGYKSEGMILPSEINSVYLTTNPLKIGEIIDVFIIKTETETGLVELSKNRADERKGWGELRDAYNHKKTVAGKITAAAKAGYTVQFWGINAFLPFSQSGIFASDKPETWVGKTLPFHILEIDEKQNKVLVSRRLLVQQERLNQRKESFKNIQAGEKVKGTVRSVTTFGAFINIGGVDGLLHISDMAWLPVKSPEDIVKPGDTLEVMILKVDAENQKVSLGLKQLLANPWDELETKYPVGTIITGKVTSLMDYGAFVEIEPGIEGMIHVSEMSWTQRIKHPKELLSPKKEVQAKILAIDKPNHRISLGLRQTQSDPWADVETKYGIGTTVHGTITGIIEHGIVISIAEGIEGMVHKMDLSWTKQINPSEAYQVGQEVDAKVLKINHPKRRLSLGIKQLTPDPWKQFLHEHKENSSITGTVTKITDGGITVEFGEGIDGFCPVRALETHRMSDARVYCKIGDSLEFKLQKIDQKTKRLTISRRALVEEQEKAAVKAYSQQDTKIGMNLGDLFKKALSDKQDTLSTDAGETNPPILSTPENEENK